MDEILAKVIAYRQRLIDELPRDAFKYEQGTRRVRCMYRCYVPGIEAKVLQFKVAIMKEHIRRASAAITTPPTGTTAGTQTTTPAVKQ